jgi:DNA modification methylase
MPVRGKYSPVDPVAYGAPVACPNKAEGVLSAVTGTNAELMEQVAKLWIKPGDRVADVTYGNGTFWKKCQGIAVSGSDIRTGTDLAGLPYSDDSVDVLVLDPPYQPQHGQPGRDFGVGRTYAIGESALQTISDVLYLYEDGIAEASRVLARDGRIMVKCQDFTYNHRLHLVHLDIVRLMAKYGLDLADMFVLVNQTRMPQRVATQQRARRAHSYLMVGAKL